jgi:uncharacterized protein (UPF0332 family)
VTPEKYIGKAAHASRSARLLLEAGENEGACNRAYYAMFNAAHAALLWSGAHINPAETKKHNSLIAAFGRHLVLTGLIPSELGKSLNRAESIRILADYTGEEIEQQKAAEIVELARLFINAIEYKFCPATKQAGNSCPSALP